MNKADLAYAIGLPPEQAIAYLKAKGYAFSWNWHEVWQEAQRKAFTVAKAMRQNLLEDIRGTVEAALAEGQTLVEFSRALEPTLKAKGWWGRKEVVDQATGEIVTVQLGSPWRLKTIYRTNLQTAFMAGRWQAQAEGARERPYLQYVAVLDARTRPSHALLHGKVFKQNDPFWNDFYPPNGWGCRCRVRALSVEDVAERKLRIEDSAGKVQMKTVPVGNSGKTAEVASYRGVSTGGQRFTMAPDAGWSYNPGRENWLRQRQ